MQARYPLPEESDIMNDWTDAIDTIIDNLQPESVSKDQSRSVTLHSAVTKETAVLHAAQDDDPDAVLVVNEENAVEAPNSSLKTKARNNGNHQPVLMQSSQSSQHNLQHQQLHLQQQRQHHQPLHPQQSLQQHHQHQQQHMTQQHHIQQPATHTINHHPNVPNILQNLPGVTLHPAGTDTSPRKQNFVAVNNEVQILPTPPKPQEVQMYPNQPKPQEIQILPTPPKPTTYVPIPSKNQKSKLKNAPGLPKLNVPLRSPNPQAPRQAFVPVNSAVQILPKRPTFVPVRPRQQSPIQPKKAPIRVEPKQKATPPKVVRTEPKPVEANPVQPEIIQTKTIHTPATVGLKQNEKQPVELKAVEIKPVELKQVERKPQVSHTPKPATPKPTHPFSCSVCHEKFKAQDVMENHMKIHSDKHKCQTCGLVCTKARELIEHQRIHSGAKLVKCNICDKDFTEKGLKLHSDRFHKVEKKSPNKRASKENVCYMEDKITFTSSSESEPDEPEIISEEDEEEEEEEEPQVKKMKGRPTKMKKSELCEMCDKYFTKKGMKLHMARYHKDEDGAPRKHKKDKKKNPPLKKLFTCGFCEKKFSHLASMKVHEKVHLGGKPHQCDMCEAKFSNKFDLFAHEKTHSALRPHKCDECTETFKTAESLRFHKLIHVESQPNICRFCKKCFKNKNQLDLHERVHTGEKPFKCTQCDLCFETASKLTRHITGTHMS